MQPREECNCKIKFTVCIQNRHGKSIEGDPIHNVKLTYTAY